MDGSAFSAALLIAQSGGYFLIFIGAFFEGPTITAAASFLASQGFFNIYLIFFISFLGNAIPDVIFYWIGRAGRKSVIGRYGPYVGLKKNYVKKASKYFKNNSRKAIIVSKLVPFMGIPGMFSAGATKVKFRDFVLTDFTFNFFGALIFTLIGFYFGLAFNKISGYLGYIFPAIAVVIILFGIIPIIYRKLSGKISNEMEKDLNM